ncbi:hypothetical protein Nans01_26490 [Nocardiopsis ansamitocini]|uniref:Uncharacterized protein n=1 Tax=Nocardiopsis ansamitocini TaxID=1670832 RepID=A0A9W6P772_9ACTN|nr:hypothetical protein Nans01_26490 [Nocardiopsis ansamitocini]
MTDFKDRTQLLPDHTARQGDPARQGLRLLRRTGVVALRADLNSESTRNESTDQRHGGR